MKSSKILSFPCRFEMRTDFVVLVFPMGLNLFILAVMVPYHLIEMLQK